MLTDLPSLTAEDLEIAARVDNSTSDSLNAGGYRLRVDHDLHAHAPADLRSLLEKVSRQRVALEHIANCKSPDACGSCRSAALGALHPVD